MWSCVTYWLLSATRKDNIFFEVHSLTVHHTYVESLHVSVWMTAELWLIDCSFIRKTFIVSTSFNARISPLRFQKLLSVSGHLSRFLISKKVNDSEHLGLCRQKPIFLFYTNVLRYVLVNETNIQIHSEIASYSTNWEIQVNDTENSVSNQYSYAERKKIAEVLWHATEQAVLDILGSALTLVERNGS